VKKDALLEEFLEVMKPKSQTKLWSNDDVLTATIAKEISQAKKPKIEAKVAQVENKRPGGKGIMLKKLHVKFDESESEDELYEELPDVVSCRFF
jgi:multiple RNA-binding domain-containing protein 1